MGDPPNRWIVLKFGGTSVSSLESWSRVEALVRKAAAEVPRVLVVHSALDGVTESLEDLLALAVRRDYDAQLESLIARHADLAEALGVGADVEVEREFAELRQVLRGVSLLGQYGPEIEARALATGELVATRIGSAFFRRRGLSVRWEDARTLLTSAGRHPRGEGGDFLMAGCANGPDPDLALRLSRGEPVVVTQGFIASDPQGRTVLLGKGGSDTSAAYLAVRLNALRLQIWTDVSGMFTADPRLVPSARLLKALDYGEAQEIATMGGRVVHPRCISAAREFGLPIEIGNTADPDGPGTAISRHSIEAPPQVKAISRKSHVQLISMETIGMWHEVGFLADAFAAFAECGISVDLVSTSETNVTVSLDIDANRLDAQTLEQLVERLERSCRVRIIGPCVAISLVGRSVRAMLHRLAPVLEVFEEEPVHLVSQAASDLNLTVVVEEENADRLVHRLHEVLIGGQTVGPIFGPTWEELAADRREGEGAPPRWWRRSRERLLEIGRTHPAAYVYDLESLAVAARDFAGMAALDRVFFSMKANAHPAVLKAVTSCGVGIECVSLGEVEHARKHLPGIAPQGILFTPNFAPRGEYEAAVALGVILTIDSLYPLRCWPDAFRDTELLVRVDPGQGRGHHEKVRTAGGRAKFGVPLEDLDEFLDLAGRAGAEVVGLHAHTGSGIRDEHHWRDTAVTLAAIAQGMPSVRILDLGGGLAVPTNPREAPLDLELVQRELSEVKQAHPHLSLWMEPGRYLVAEAGVLLARVTQTKKKGPTAFVGVATGMNSLIRPALYGAYHEIVNLTRLDQPPSEVVTVVGPICESGDRFGTGRYLPETREGDVLLIAGVGAYGRTMASSYNMREPAPELTLG